MYRNCPKWSRQPSLFGLKKRGGANYRGALNTENTVFIACARIHENKSSLLSWSSFSLLVSFLSCEDGSHGEGRYEKRNACFNNDVKRKAFERRAPSTQEVLRKLRAPEEDIEDDSMETNLNNLPRNQTSADSVAEIRRLTSAPSLPEAPPLPVASMSATASSINDPAFGFEEWLRQSRSAEMMSDWRRKEGSSEGQTDGAWNRRIEGVSDKHKNTRITDRKERKRRNAVILETCEFIVIPDGVDV